MNQQQFIYPNAPGYKAPGTSQEAAKKVAPKASVVRLQIINAFRSTGRDFTPDEMAAYLKIDKGTVRPRFTELSKQNPPLIEKTGERRKNSRGNNQAVWRLVK